MAFLTHFIGLLSYLLNNVVHFNIRKPCFKPIFFTLILSPPTGYSIKVLLSLCFFAFCHYKKRIDVRFCTHLSNCWSQILFWIHSNFFVTAWDLSSLGTYMHKSRISICCMSVALFWWHLCHQYLPYAKVFGQLLT